MEAAEEAAKKKVDADAVDLFTRVSRLLPGPAVIGRDALPPFHVSCSRVASTA